MVRRLKAFAAGSLVMAFAAAPLSVLLSQETPRQPTPTWGGAPGQAPKSQGAAGEVRADGRFIADATQDNLFEMELGQTAASKAQGSAVRDFAKRMTTDHNRMQDQWSALLTKHGIEYRTVLRPEQEQQMRRLEQLSGSEFDRAYMGLMIQGHQDAVTKFQNQGRAARSAEVRQLVDAGLPVLEQHLSMARQLGGQVNAGPIVTGPTPPVQNTPVTGSAAVRADSTFVREVVHDNLLEVRLAETADKKAENSAVKQFARRMRADHIRLQDQWTGLAARSGMQINPRLDPADVQEANRIASASGKEFDRAYMRLMVLGHENTVAEFERQSRSAQSADVRQLAAASLPVLQEHSRLAKQVGSQVDADIPAGGGDVASADVRRDREFIRDAVADNFLETRMGELAERRARSSEVKQFGRRMASDHTRMQEQWVSMAASNGRPLTPGIGPLHRKKLNRLEKVSDREFDRVYMTLVIQNHKDYLDYFRKEGRAAHSSAVRGLVDAGIPVLEQHWDMAKRIGAEVGAEIAVDGRGNARTSSFKK
jgi:putative membrane protein